MNLETRNPMMSVSVRMRSPAVIYRRYFISSGRTANDVCTVGLYRTVEVVVGTCTVLVVY